MTAFYALGLLALVFAVCAVALVAYRVWTKRRAERAPHIGLAGFGIGNWSLPLAALCLAASLGFLKLAEDAAENASAQEHWQRKVESLRSTDGYFGAAQYSALEPGRPVGEVIYFLGGDYEELRRSADGEAVLRWRRADGASITATFRNGNLAEKAQDGL